MSLLPFNQRWLRGFASYRPPDEPIRTADYDVIELSEDAPAKAFVLEHHYSGSYPAARWRFGLFRRGVLQGVAVFSHPCNDRVLTSIFPGRATDSVELGRFVLLDEVPGNGETWMLGRCFRLLRRAGLAGVVAFPDPCRRLNRDGATVFGGHIGTVYQAHNGVYLGRAAPRTLTLLPDGRVLSDRAQQKVRAADRGVRYAVRQLVACGAEPPRAAAGGAALPQADRPLNPQLGQTRSRTPAWPPAGSRAMPLKVGLVACSKTKADGPRPAAELYTSPLFRKAAAYCRRHYDRWFILSALHGLVEPSTVLAPYDLTLTALTPTEREAWADPGRCGPRPPRPPPLQVLPARRPGLRGRAD
jgi:hypothetical protein